MENQIKLCPVCKITKERSFFYKDKSRKDGTVSTCKQCFGIKIPKEDLGDKKRCKNCKEVFEINVDNFHQKSPGKFNANCRTCHNKICRKRSKSADNIKSSRTKCRNTNLKNYNLTPESYNEMLESQKHVCKICNKDEIRLHNGNKIDLSVDHCHKTGIIRGLLCKSCNSGIGFLKDDPVIIMNAYIYIKEFIAELEPEQYLDWD